MNGLQVLIFCVEFWKLSHLTCDLSQAEKKITVVTIGATSTILSEKICHFVHLLSLYLTIFVSSQIEISHV